MVKRGSCNHRWAMRDCRWSHTHHNEGRQECAEKGEHTSIGSLACSCCRWSNIKTFRGTSKDLHFTSPSPSLQKRQQPIYTMPSLPFHQPSRRHRTRWPAWLAPIRQSHRHRNPKVLGSIPSKTRKTERNDLKGQSKKKKDNAKK